MLLLLVHPLFMLFIAVLLDTYTHFPELGLGRVVGKAVVGSKRALMYSVVDAMVYSNWVFDVAVLCLLPVWLLLWQVVQHPVVTVVEEQDKDSATTESSHCKKE